MSEAIPTTWNDERDAAFFGITEALLTDGFREETTRLAASVSSAADRAAQIEKVLEDLTAAESWELMAIRSAGRSELR